MPTTTPTSFLSDGQRCAAWVTLPDEAGPHPGVALVHGLGATHEMALRPYEQTFAVAGIAVLAFDFRHIGCSAGEPRQVISLRRQLADVAAALRFLRRHPDVDGRRIGLWGTSLGAMHVLRTAASHPDLRAAVVQCPIVHGPSAALSSGIAAGMRLLPALCADLLAAALHRDRRYIAIVGEPGTRAMVTAPGAKEGWESVMPPGYEFDNRVAAAGGLELIAANAARTAHRVRAPLLVCVSDRESLMSPKIAHRVAQRAPLGEARHYDADHFDVYHPPLLHRMLADQTSFLVEHLAASSNGMRTRG